ncbi:HAD-IA family hydrolase [Microbacterium oxydans]|uniref:HAD-IA family hydrolase n=1 Tax=Microbacterium oxydans TaxID=82380 RepID=UPI0005ECA787|nr:HAD-IA family hydrolase [Microbacterium oxydans]
MSIELPRPKYISFDVIGTLIYFEMRKTVEPLLADRITGDDFEAFYNRFRLDRYDEIMEYRPYEEILDRAFRRTAARFDVEVRESDVATILEDMRGWGAHPDVPAALATMAEHFPLVALSNADDSHLANFIPRLGAPFHTVITAEQTRAYKPRHQAFDHMLKQLDAKPEDFLHISSHQLYDHVPMSELGFTNKVFLDRGYDPDLPHYGAVRMTSLDEVNRALGIA